MTLLTISSRAFAPCTWLPLAALAALASLAGCGGMRLHFPLDDQPAAAKAPAARASGGQWGDPLPAPGASAAATPASAASSAAVAYVIGPEDGLDISVWKDDTLKSTTVVRPDGGISFPLVGDVQAAGKTTEELRDELRRRLEKYIPDAVVTVAVVHVASYRIYVLGRVNKPGDIAVGRDVDVLQALALAGGMTPFAHEDDIRVVRKVDGKTVTIPFHYSQVIKDGDLAQDITLRTGDVLLVP